MSELNKTVDANRVANTIKNGFTAFSEWINALTWTKFLFFILLVALVPVLSSLVAIVILVSIGIKVLSNKKSKNVSGS